MNTERLHFAMPRPVPPGLWRRVPPAVFPPVLGLSGLALAWIAGVSAFALPPAVAGLLAGMVVAVAGFALTAYGVKLARRPAVLFEELAVLPGRAGVAAAVLTVYLVSALIGALVSVPAGRALLVAGLALHAVLIAALLIVFRRGPSAPRRVTPAWHLSFVGPVVAARVALLLGWPGLAPWLAVPAAVMALAIYAVSLRQAMTERVPAPLRPLLAVHLAPVALFGTVALGLGWTATGTALAWVALFGAVLLAGSARWLLADGFSPFWGALTFPLAATAGLWVSLWRSSPAEPLRLIAGGLLVAATLVTVPVAFAVLRLWAQGRLPVRTNAAIA